MSQEKNSFKEESVELAPRPANKSWGFHQEEIRKLNVTAAQYCRERNLSLKGLYDFRRRQLLKRRSEQSPKKRAKKSFLDVSVSSQTPMKLIDILPIVPNKENSVKFHLPNHIALECPISSVGEVYHRLLQGQVSL